MEGEVLPHIKDFTPHPELSRYNAMPKHFVGPEAADDLFSIYHTLSEEKPYPSYLYVAGSAAAESGLIGTHLLEVERHRRVQRAREAWLNAQTLYIERHVDEEWTEAKLTAFTDRVEAQIIYTNLLHDMINGHVRQETIDTVHYNLIRLAVRNLNMYEQGYANRDHGAISSRRGLAHELATTGAITRLRCPSFFAMPTVARGDDGSYFKDEVHDVQVLEQSWGAIRSAVPIEVKPSGAYQLGRYKSAVVKGRVHLKLPSATSGLELSRYLAKELKGEASAQEIEELNQVTSRILTEVQTATRHDYEYSA